MSTATYTKLKNQSWGLRVVGPVKAGDTLTVTKQSGETKTETVEAVLWTGDNVALCSIAKTAHSAPTRSAPARSSYGGYRRKACVTDGNCSSMGSGRSCGGYDCDGY